MARRNAATGGWTGLLAAVAVSACVGGYAAPAPAKEPLKCAVSKIKFDDDNTGTIDLNLVYVDNETGKKGTFEGIKGVGAGQSVSINLENHAGKVPEGQNGPAFGPLAEVWLTGTITLGEHFNCRMDNHRLFFVSFSSNTAKFKVKGSTLTGNRCRFNGNWDDICNAEDSAAYDALGIGDNNSGN